MPATLEYETGMVVVKQGKDKELFRLSKKNLVHLYPKVKLANDFVEDGQN